jgi:hypothetical protein
MTERQYKQTLTNRSRPGPPPLFETKSARRVLQRAVERARLYQAATEVWNRIADPHWLPYTSVEVIKDGALLLRVGSPVVAAELRPRMAELMRRMIGSTAGARELRFVTGPGEAARGEDADRSAGGR